MVATKKIGEVFQVTSGGTPSRKKAEYFMNGTIPWVKTGDLKGKYVNTPEEKITPLGIQNSSAKIFPKNTVLLAMYGATIGACSILPMEAATNQACGALLPTSECDPIYLYYFLLSIKDDLIRKGVGGAQPNISGGIIKDTKIPLPPLDQQKKIAAILDEADTYRQKTKALIEKYNQLTQSLFLDMFSGLIGEKVPLSSICEVNPKKSEIAPVAKSTMVSFVPMAHVSEEGELNLTEERPLGEVWSGFTYFKEYDVVFAKITPCMENGKGAIMRGLKNFIGFGTTEFHVLRPMEELTTPEYLFHLTHSSNFRMLAELNMSGSAGQKRVPKDFFKKFKVVPPPIVIQKQFAERVQAIEAQKAHAKASLAQADNLFNSLLQKAFKGELL